MRLRAGFLRNERRGIARMSFQDSFPTVRIRRFENHLTIKSVRTQKSPLRDSRTMGPLKAK